eukprot:TRINITY_DN8839_c0_g1_i3.p1 TRINITY_DN8839_c0_g1~~TRINITY_DN8839_c0_g1_i3.p1  ORF type:complete len:294 (+),score=48.07 TRINITY_DN8839_c0_g1_i3:1202-2083(+)
MAMIFESYKKHHGEKKRSGANSVIGDLNMLFSHFGHYLRWLMSDTYYVSPITVLKIISHPLFEQSAGGCLNVFELRAAVDMVFRHQELNLGHVHWIMRTYGKQSAHSPGVSYGAMNDIFNENLIKETFELVDQDHDGKVSVTELRSALKGMGQRFTDKALDRMISTLEVQEDAVEAADWVTICRDLHRVMSFDVGSKRDEQLLGMEFAHQYDDQCKLDTPPDTPTPVSRNPSGVVDELSPSDTANVELVTMYTHAAMSSSSSSDGDPRETTVLKPGRKPIVPIEGQTSSTPGI